MTREGIRERLQKDLVDYILVQYVDIHGTPRCKGVPARALDQLLAGSAGFAGAAVLGMGQGPHDHDMIALPDLASYTLVPWEEVRARKLQFIPQSLPEALQALAQDEVIQSALGRELTQEFLTLKQQEWVRYHNTVSPWELDTYLTLF